jgi:hypothetical protein
MYSKDNLEGIIKEVFNNQNEKRVFKILTGCKTNGITNLEFGNICSDPTCYSCSNFRKLIEEEFKKEYGKED